jgi:hypothetical protein
MISAKDAYNEKNAGFFGGLGGVFQKGPGRIVDKFRLGSKAQDAKKLVDKQESMKKRVFEHINKAKGQLTEGKLVSNSGKKLYGNAEEAKRESLIRKGKTSETTYGKQIKSLQESKRGRSSTNKPVSSSDSYNHVTNKPTTISPTVHQEAVNSAKNNIQFSTPGVNKPATSAHVAKPAPAAHSAAPAADKQAPAATATSNDPTHMQRHWKKYVAGGSVALAGAGGYALGSSGNKEKTAGFKDVLNKIKGALSRTKKVPNPYEKVTISPKVHQDAVNYAHKHKVEIKTPKVPEKVETTISDAVHSEKPNKIKENLQTYWPHYAIAGAAGIGGIAYLRKKNRDKQNAAA